MGEMEIDLPIEKKQIKRWNINNKEGWKKYNDEFKRRYKNKKPRNSKEMNKLITSTMRYTIGQTNITIGNKNTKESEQVKKLRKERKQARLEFEKATKNDREHV